MCHFQGMLYLTRFTVIISILGGESSNNTTILVHVYYSKLCSIQCNLLLLLLNSYLQLVILNTGRIYDVTILYYTITTDFFLYQYLLLLIA